VWDLHFHTPSSFDYSDKSVTNQQIIDALVNAGVSVVAVTDHHVIDVPRFEELQALAAGSVVFLPGIEFRTELGGSDSVHVIGVLPEDCNLNLAWDTIRVNHKIDLKLAERGDQGVYATFRDFARDIHDLGGLTIVHAGSKSNSIEEISGSTAFKQALKSDLACEASDVFEIAKSSNVGSYRDIVFPKIKKELPLVLCSDAHGIKDYTPPACWIKADPTFYGLSQVIHDPQDRVFLGKTPPALVRVRENKTKYISSVTFSRVAGSSLPEKWFDGVSVPLNPGLVAIIGNKGSGKSALAESIGLLGGSPLRDEFSFLHRDRFLHGKTPKASHFEGSLAWEDGAVTTLGLADSNDSLEQRLRYIPQNYLETVCNELKAGEDSEFTHQIEQVILSHVPLGEREGHDSLASLLNDWTSEIKTGIEHGRNKIRGLNADVAECELRLQPAFRTATEQGLQSKRKEIEVLDAARPAPVAKPPEDLSTSPEMKSKLADVDRLDAELRALDDQLKENLLAKQETKRAMLSCDKLLQAVDNFSAHYTDLYTVWEVEGIQAGVSIGEIVTHAIARDVLLDRSTHLRTVLEALERSASPLVDGSLEWRRVETRAALALARSELSAPSQAYQRYLDEEQLWVQKQADLVGTADAAGSLAWHEAQLAALDSLPERLRSLYTRRDQLVREVFEGLSKWRASLEQAYGPVQDYIREHPLMSRDAEFDFAAAVSDVSLADDFFDVVHQGRRGSFCRDGVSLLERLIDGADFSTSDGVLAFIQDILDHLTTNQRSTPATSLAIEDQLKEGHTRSDVYDVLYCLGYLEPTYSLRWAGKGLDLLSPGERGALLLVFYLLIDKDKNPLLIDQPEENLDNRTVYKNLVPCVNEARRRRQIILVTHNPNLAVVCDADQVIAASLASDGSCALSYTSGAIENPRTSEAIVDVLEGTKPAFEKRDHKYAAALTDWLI